jgi:hypothetical protein
LQGVFKAFGKWLEYRFRAYFKLGRCKLSLDDDLDNFIKKIDLVDSFKETFNRKMCGMPVDGSSNICIKHFNIVYRDGKIVWWQDFVNGKIEIHGEVDDEI